MELIEKLLLRESEEIEFSEFERLASLGESKYVERKTFYSWAKTPLARSGIYISQTLLMAKSSRI
jgi:hypothetical protein